MILVSASACANNENVSNKSTDDWADEWAEQPPASPWQITGFIEAAHGQFLQTNVTKKSASLSELKTRVNIDYSHELFDVSGKLDSYYDDVLAKTIFQTRELSISASPFSFVDIKAGRQVLTWGTGDYLFLNDLFAKDWQSFFSGRADEYLKAPSNSVRTNWFYKAMSLTLVWTPEFTSDNYLNGERFSFYSPQAQQIIAPANGLSVQKNHESQWSVRLKTHINNLEVALYGYKGYWPTPEGTKTSSQLSSPNQAYFPKLNVWGASAITAFKGGIFNAEYASYNSTENSQGMDNMVANGQHRLLIGYEREIAKNLTASMQYYLERTKYYQALKANSQKPEQLVAENRHLLTLRLNYRALRQTLTYSVFAFYSPSDKDGYLKPAINYQYNDQWLFSTGANVFFGKKEFSFFGQLENNTNAWLSARYQY